MTALPRAQFLKLWLASGRQEVLATVGSTSRSDIQLTRTALDDKPPRLHVGKWSKAAGEHERFGGFLTDEMARALYVALGALYGEEA